MVLSRVVQRALVARGDGGDRHACALWPICPVRRMGWRGGDRRSGGLWLRVVGSSAVDGVPDNGQHDRRSIRDDDRRSIRDDDRRATVLVVDNGDRDVR